MDRSFFLRIQDWLFHFPHSHGRELRTHAFENCCLNDMQEPKLLLVCLFARTLQTMNSPTSHVL